VEAQINIRMGTVGKKMSLKWLEWLMGYPIGHTELSHWVIPWFQGNRKKLSKS
jgi:hypothetical protein